MPATWKTYGTDANRDGTRPLQPGRRDLRRRPVPEGGRLRETTCAARSSPTTTPTGTSPTSCSRARLIAGVPADWSAALTGLADGRFPVRGRPLRRRARPTPARARRARREPGARGRDDASATTWTSRASAREGDRVSDGVVRACTRPSAAAARLLEDTYGNRYSYYGIRRMSEGFDARAQGSDDGSSASAAARRARRPAGDSAPTPVCASASGPPARTRRRSIPSRCSTAGGCSRRPPIYRAVRQERAPATRRSSRSARRSCCRSRCSRGACSPTAASTIYPCGRDRHRAGPDRPPRPRRCSPSSPRAG